MPEDAYDFGLTSYPNPGPDGLVARADRARPGHRDRLGVDARPRGSSVTGASIIVPNFLLERLTPEIARIMPGDADSQHQRGRHDRGVASGRGGGVPLLPGQGGAYGVRGAGHRAAAAGSADHPLVPDARGWCGQAPERGGRQQRPDPDQRRVAAHRPDGRDGDVADPGRHQAAAGARVRSAGPALGPPRQARATWQHRRHRRNGAHRGGGRAAVRGVRGARARAAALANSAAAPASSGCLARTASTNCWPNRTT